MVGASIVIMIFAGLMVILSMSSKEIYNKYCYKQN